MPEAGILGSGIEYLAPSIWALMNGTEHLALLDCNHKWWSDPRTYRWDKAVIAAKMCGDYKETPRASHAAGAGYLARAVLTLRLERESPRLQLLQRMLRRMVYKKPTGRS